MGMHTLGLLLILFIISSSPPAVFADAIVEPHYTHCCLPRTGAHGPIPTSISGTTDSYEIMVTNSRNVSMIATLIYIPTDFEFVNASASESNWAMNALHSQVGGPIAVIWNGSKLSPGTNTTFTFALRNPDVGLHLSAVYTFLIIQTYVGGAYDAVRDPVEIIQPIRMFGIDSPTIALGLLAVVFTLLVLEAILPVRNRGSTVAP